MISVDDLITQVSGNVADLASRVQGALEFSTLMKSNALPAVTPAAFVLPTGLNGGKGDAMTGAFTQPVERVFSVVLVLRNTDRTGAKGIDPLDGLITDTINAVAGWAPAGAVGVFRLARGAPVSLSAGTAVYQLDFAISDQVRTLQ